MAPGSPSPTCRNQHQGRKTAGPPSLERRTDPQRRGDSNNSNVNSAPREGGSPPTTLPKPGGGAGASSAKSTNSINKLSPRLVRHLARWAGQQTRPLSQAHGELGHPEVSGPHRAKGRAHQRHRPRVWVGEQQPCASYLQLGPRPSFHLANEETQISGEEATSPRHNVHVAEPDRFGPGAPSVPPTPSPSLVGRMQGPASWG